MVNGLNSGRKGEVMLEGLGIVEKGIVEVSDEVTEVWGDGKSWEQEFGGPADTSGRAVSLVVGARDEFG